MEECRVNVQDAGDPPARAPSPPFAPHPLPSPQQSSHTHTTPSPCPVHDVPTTTVQGCSRPSPRQGCGVGREQVPRGACHVIRQQRVPGERGLRDRTSISISRRTEQASDPTQDDGPRGHLRRWFDHSKVFVCPPSPVDLLPPSPGSGGHPVEFVCLSGIALSRHFIHSAALGHGRQSGKRE